MFQLSRLLYRQPSYRLLIPFEGHVQTKVKKGDSVHPGDVLFVKTAKKIISSSFIPTELGVKIEDAKDYIVRLNGEYVLKGEVLAEKMVAGGLSIKRLYAGEDGILNLNRIDKGFVDILSESTSEEYYCESFGRVLDVDLTNGLSIETLVWKLPLLTDNYHEKPNEYKNVRVGNFKVVGDGSSVYVDKNLEDDYKGCIVYAGRFAYPELLKEIYKRGAEYVMVYSMDYQDFASLPFAVGIIGGFGHIPYPKEYVEIAKGMKDSFCSVDLTQNTIVWPDKGRYLTKNPIEINDTFISELRVGMYVRVVDSENFRALARVLDVNTDENMVSIEFEDGRRSFVSSTILLPVQL
ncbi:MAG TPA: hypothetical protein PLV59_00480 [Candidatus Dojkabacteria bacterium]|nr:hypothetical protein [Candidatus Dojkabacteria bacterium]